MPGSCPMRDLQSIVCVKIVPKPEEIRVDPETIKFSLEHRVEFGNGGSLISAELRRRGATPTAARCNRNHQ